MKTRIMIAEDNTSIISCYQDLLSKDETIEIVGYTMNGNDTIRMYIEKQPDLLLLDLNIPKKNGLEIIYELQQLEDTKANCNIIIISGEHALLRKLFYTRKIFMVLPKPVNSSILLSTIKDFQKTQFINLFSEEKCQMIFKRLNINPISKKGRILTQAIETCYSDYNFLDNMELLYFTLGAKNSCSPQKIKSSLRATADNVSANIDYHTLTTIFPTEIIDEVKGITPKSFINGMVYSLK